MPVGLTGNRRSTNSLLPRKTTSHSGNYLIFWFPFLRKGKIVHLHQGRQTELISITGGESAALKLLCSKEGKKKKASLSYLT